MIFTIQKITYVFQIFSIICSIYNKNYQYLMMIQKHYHKEIKYRFFDMFRSTFYTKFLNLKQQKSFIKSFDILKFHKRMIQFQLMKKVVLNQRSRILFKLIQNKDQPLCKMKQVLQKKINKHPMLTTNKYSEFLKTHKENYARLKQKYNI